MYGNFRVELPRKKNRALFGLVIFHDLCIKYLENPQEQKIPWNFHVFLALSWWLSRMVATKFSRFLVLSLWRVAGKQARLTHIALDWQAIHTIRAAPLWHCQDSYGLMKFHLKFHQWDMEHHLAIAHESNPMHVGGGARSGSTNFRVGGQLASSQAEGPRRTRDSDPHHVLLHADESRTSESFSEPGIRCLTTQRLLTDWLRMAGDFYRLSTQQTGTAQPADWFFLELPGRSMDFYRNLPGNLHPGN